MTGVGTAAGPLGRRGLLVLLVVLAAGLGLRLAGVATSPFQFHPTRQYQGLQIARAWYVEDRNDVPAWQREAAEANGRRSPHFEPRVLESAAYLGYRLSGGERLWVGGALSAAVWVLAGGAALFLLARRLSSSILVAGVALGLYLFLPYGVEASRSFQPDPAMVACTVVAVLALVVAFGRGTWPAAAGAGAACALAVLLKPAAVFFLAGAFAALALGPRPRGAFVRVAAGVALALLAPAAFYGLAARDGEVGSFAQTSFLPDLWTAGEYWRGWGRLIGETVGWVPALVALGSVAVATRPAARRLMAGLWVGYLAYGLAFTYHAHTHDYYHLPLVPIVALGVGLSVEAGVARVRGMDLSAVGRVGLVGAAGVFALALGVQAVDVARPVSDAAVGRVVSQAETVGRLVDHSTRTVMLAPVYGTTLTYYGYLAGSSWPNADDLRFAALTGGRAPAAEERLSELVDGGAEWFIVTDLPEFRRQPDLAAALDRRARVAGRGRDYLVYDLRAPGPL